LKRKGLSNIKMRDLSRFRLTLNKNSIQILKIRRKWSWRLLNYSFPKKFVILGKSNKTT